MTSWLGRFYFESETSHDSQRNYFRPCGVPLMAHSSKVAKRMSRIWRTSTHYCEVLLSFQLHVSWTLSLESRCPFSISGNRLLSVIFIFLCGYCRARVMSNGCPIWSSTSGTCLEHPTVMDGKGGKDSVLDLCKKKIIIIENKNKQTKSSR